MGRAHSTGRQNTKNTRNLSIDQEQIIAGSGRNVSADYNAAFSRFLWGVVQEIFDTHLIVHGIKVT